MINTYAMQGIFADPNDWIGFAIAPNSGCVRHLAYRLHKVGIDVSIQDIVETLNYMLSRGWLRESGLWGNQKLYSLKREAKCAP